MPVAQRRLYRPAEHPLGAQRGDCLAACVASVFEVPYHQASSAVGHSQALFDWTREHYPWLRAEHRTLGDTWKGVETLDSYKEWPERHFEHGYWIATVWSPRIPDIETPDGIAWGLHAVVMHGWDCVWDPHPRRAEGFGPFRGATTWHVLDPAHA